MLGPGRAVHRRSALRSAVVSVVVLVSACQASAPAQPATASAGPVSPPAATAPPSATASAAPATASPLPLAIPRPTDLPTDGRCESGHTCLGLLAAGTHHTKAFSPGFGFRLASGGWENLADTGGDLLLLSTTTPGDLIGVFRQPRATKPDGTLVAGVDIRVKALQAWLASNPAVIVSPATEALVGGLAGVRMDVALAPGLQSHQSDCPVQVCASVLAGRAKTWAWDMGLAGPERERFYLLTAKDGVVLIVVDSLDGTTFDSLTADAETILATLKFDGT